MLEVWHCVWEKQGWNQSLLMMSHIRNNGAQEVKDKGFFMAVCCSCSRGLLQHHLKFRILSWKKGIYCRHRDFFSLLGPVSIQKAIYTQTHTNIILYYIISIHDRFNGLWNAKSSSVWSQHALVCSDGADYYETQISIMSRMDRFCQRCANSVTSDISPSRVCVCVCVGRTCKECSEAQTGRLCVSLCVRGKRISNVGCCSVSSNKCVYCLAV